MAVYRCGADQKMAERVDARGSVTVIMDTALIDRPLFSRDREHLLFQRLGVSNASTSSAYLANDTETTIPNAR